MKRLLFIISNLESGGVSKSMVSLLNTIDRERYDVSLLILNPSGLFMELLPKDVRIITNPDMAALGMRVGGAWSLLKRGRIALTFGHLVRMALSCVSKSWAGWLLSRLMPALEQEFDCVVDYNGQHQLYYMVDKVRAKKKITFFHSDYDKWSYYRSMDARYFPKVDNIFTVSEHCVASLKRNFPDVASKVACMENISNPKLIDEMSGAPIDDMSEDVATILTLGHICKAKGSDLAIKAAGILKQQGVQFKWYFLGLDSKDMDYSALIKECGVEDCVVLLGLRVNPYPYIKRATIYVHPTLFEGKSIALDEAKLMCKPVVVTNFSTVQDQFQDRVNGTICEMTPEALATSVEELLTTESLRDRYSKYLREHRVDNCNEINRLYDMFDSV
ncbi:MAG: glycosyltransferase [Alistipes sp.]|nr:glycosyltransferase [Alistipes sp.]